MYAWNKQEVTKTSKSPRGSRDARTFPYMWHMIVKPAIIVQNRVRGVIQFQEVFQCSGWLFLGGLDLVDRDRWYVNCSLGFRTQETKRRERKEELRKHGKEVNNLEIYVCR
jgi:hypothetical protein